MYDLIHGCKEIYSFQAFLKYEIVKALWFIRVTSSQMVFGLKF